MQHRTGNRFGDRTVGSFRQRTAAILLFAVNVIVASAGAAEWKGKTQPLGATSWTAAKDYAASNSFAESSLGGNELWSDEFPFIGAVGSMGNMMSGYVFDLTQYQGKLIVGGQFGYIDGVQVSDLATWDGQEWRAFPEAGVGSAVRCLLAYGDTLVAG